MHIRPPLEVGAARLRNGTRPTAATGDEHTGDHRCKRVFDRWPECCAKDRRVRRSQSWCPGGESNPHATRTLEPKSSPSTNSGTWAIVTQHRRPTYDGQQATVRRARYATAVARVVKLVDTRDLKSLGEIHAGSTPAPGTIPHRDGGRTISKMLDTTRLSVAVPDALT